MTLCQISKECVLAVALTGCVTLVSSVQGADDSTNKPAAAKAATPATAEAAVKAVINGLQQGQAVVLWEFLPESYQKDINDFVRRSARNSDAELHNRFFQTARRFLTIAQTKRRFILESIREEDGLNNTESTTTEAEFDVSMKMLETICNCELSEIEKLRSFDGGSFSAGTLTRYFQQLMEHPTFEKREWEELSSRTKVDQVVADDQTVVVRFIDPTESDKSKPDTSKMDKIEFARVEGKWIPKELAEAWKDIAATTKVAQQTSRQRSPQEKEKALKPYEAVDRFLDRLEAANTQEEFDVVIEKAMRLIAGRLYRGILKRCLGIDLPHQFTDEYVEAILDGSREDKKSARASYEAVESDRTVRQGEGKEVLPKKNRNDNVRVAEQIANRLSAAKLTGYDMMIRFKNETAELTGDVGSAEQRELATREASKVPGVNSVINRLKVKK